jgi:hypothetical protein
MVYGQINVMDLSVRRVFFYFSFVQMRMDELIARTVL